MIQRRTLLSALPIAVLAACGRPQATQAAARAEPDMSGLPAQSLTTLLGGDAGVTWLTARGTVRQLATNAQVRPASLQRAIAVSPDGKSARFFDVWQIGNEAPQFGAVQKRGDSESQIAPNDLGENSLWLQRGFFHPAFQSPLEVSRLARKAARVMVLDTSQIWLVEGDIGPMPSLRETIRAPLEAWRTVR
jgi:hypothetical protein